MVLYNRMAKMKQTARKTDPTTGQRMKPTTASSSEDEVSPEGKQIAVFPIPIRRLPRKRPAGSPAWSEPSKKPCTRTGASTGFTSSEDSQGGKEAEEDDNGKVILNIKGGRTDGGETSKGDNPSKWPHQPVASKNLKKVKALNALLGAPKRGSSSKTLTHWWNKTGRTKATNETKRGWMKKVKKVTNAQGRILWKCHPGTVSLWEIRFYQRSWVFLIPMAAFQHVVREVASEFKDLRWQATALYHLRVTAEAYMVGVLCDTNLCTLHHRYCTIFPKDLHLARWLRGHSETGVGAAMNDQAM